MKNISYENLSFLYDLISTDLKVTTIKNNNGFTTTKINNVKQNNNLFFNNKEGDLFRICSTYTAFDTTAPSATGDEFNYLVLYGEGILLGDDFHMFGSPAGNYNPGDNHVIYHFKTNTFEHVGLLPYGFYRGSGYRTSGNGYSYGTCYNASVVYYNQKFHMFWSTSYGRSGNNINKHYILNYNEEDDYTFIDNPPMANGFFDYNTKAIVYNGKIHFFKYDSTNNVYSLLHYTYDEINGYVELSSLPFYVRTKNTNLNDIVIYHNKIHFPIAKINGDSEHIYHFIWDDTNGYRQIEQYTTAPDFSSDVFIYNDKIYMVNLASSNESTCIWDEINGLTRIDNTSFYNSSVTGSSTSANSNFFFEYNNELYYSSNNKGFYGSSFVKWNHGEWSLYRNNNYYLEI